MLAGRREILNNAQCTYWGDEVLGRHNDSDLSEIIDNLLAYEQTAGDQEESTVRAQIAIWLAQGHASEEIRERFSFTAADLDEAHRIIAGTF